MSQGVTFKQEQFYLHLICLADYIPVLSAPYCLLGYTSSCWLTQLHPFNKIIGSVQSEHGNKVTSYLILSASCSVFSLIAMVIWDTGFSIRLSTVTWGKTKTKQWSPCFYITEVCSKWRSTLALTSSLLLARGLELTSGSLQLCSGSLGGAEFGGTLW